MNDARGRAGALAVVLLAMVWPSAEHLAAPPNPALASVLALAGLLAFAWSGRAPGPAARRPGLGRSLAIGGLVLTLQGASTILLRHFGWRSHELPLGKAVSDLGVWTGERLVTLSLTFEALGHYVIWYVVIGLAVLAALSLPDRGWRSAARAA